MLYLSRNWSFDTILEWNDPALVKVIKAGRNSYNTYRQILESICIVLIYFASSLSLSLSKFSFPLDTLVALSKTNIGNQI